MKLFRLVALMFSLLLLVTLATAQSPATAASQTNDIAAAPAVVKPPTEDHQFWNEFQLVKHTGRKTDLVLIGVLRIGRDWARPVDERVGVGYAFKLNKYLTVMPTYVHVEYQPYPTRIIHEERLVLNITGKASLGKFTFTDRNLIERRVRPSVKDFTVYRNRLQIDHPAHLGKFAFKPYVANEVWHSSQTGANGQFGWFRNRISVGIIKQLTEHLSGDFFVLYQSDGLSRPGNIPVVGTLFRYTL
ncbi:MAG: DUF2490 domain-containing protein [Acidobacteria bacterium]|nr:DUF2490 domain-containing protein [Acidobacteriota bacterium]